MIGKITILSTFGEPYYSPPESLLGTEPSTGYLINTDNILPMKVYGTTDTVLDYKLNKHNDRGIEFRMIVDESNTAITTLSDATPDSNMIPLPVYEGALTFIDLTGLSTTVKYYNITNIVWGNENAAGTVTRLLITEGGFTTYPIFVNYSIDQIVDIADTGTTTTSSTSSSSTSSTSSTSTSSTSTSSTSTSSTSTSSTSTSSTSSTSTSSTSTSTSTSTTSTTIA